MALKRYICAWKSSSIPPFDVAAVDVEAKDDEAANDEVMDVEYPTFCSAYPSERLMCGGTEQVAELVEAREHDGQEPDHASCVHDLVTENAVVDPCSAVVAEVGSKVLQVDHRDPEGCDRSHHRVPNKPELVAYAFHHVHSSHCEQDGERIDCCCLHWCSWKRCDVASRNFPRIDGQKLNGHFRAHDDRTFDAPSRQNDLHYCRWHLKTYREWNSLVPRLLQEEQHHQRRMEGAG